MAQNSNAIHFPAALPSAAQVCLLKGVVKYLQAHVSSFFYFMFFFLVST